ncbi:MAG: class I SAM-dependent methyltransferase [Planctomycetes bacterium]|nr:class I SAM-dependent methyltransferase [Planctomycetota bacterium]
MEASATGDRERWDARYAKRGAVAREHTSFLEFAAAELPPRGRVLDLAGGDGRNALWFAARGLEVTICDVSPTGLAHAAQLAHEAGLSTTTLVRDLARDGLPEGPWDVVFSFHYLQRDLFPRFAEVLAPGGLLLFCQPTVCNLERHPHPSARFLLGEGELAGLVPSALEVLSLEEGWLEEGRHEARLVARRANRGD